MDRSGNGFLPKTQAAIAKQALAVALVGLLLRTHPLGGFDQGDPRVSNSGRFGPKGKIVSLSCTAPFKRPFVLDYLLPDFGGCARCSFSVLPQALGEPAARGRTADPVR